MEAAAWATWGWKWAAARLSSHRGAPVRASPWPPSSAAPVSPAPQLATPASCSSMPRSRPLDLQEKHPLMKAWTGSRKAFLLSISLLTYVMY